MFAVFESITNWLWGIPLLITIIVTGVFLTFRTGFFQFRHFGYIVKNMFNKEVVVRCESGLHNRQATYFVQKANEYESSIYLESGNRKMNAKSLLGIMSLGIITGATVMLSAVGPDAEAAVNALDTLLQRDVY